MNKAIGYIRVSEHMLPDEDVSLETQHRKIEDWCFDNDFDLITVYGDDGASGTKSDRDGLLDAKAAIAKGSKGTALVVYSLSRLTRSFEDLINLMAELDRKSAYLVSVKEEIDTTTAAGRLAFHMLGLFDEYKTDLFNDDQQ